MSDMHSQNNYGIEDHPQHPGPQPWQAQPPLQPGMYPQPDLKHSGLGIASFIMSILLGLFLFLLLIIAGIMEAGTPGGMDEESAGAVILGLFLLGSLGFELVAMVLGIAGLIQQQRKRTFAALGTAFSALTIAGFIILIMIGLSL